jgi:hypothetical protein
MLTLASCSQRILSLGEIFRRHPFGLTLGMPYPPLSFGQFSLQRNQYILFRSIGAVLWRKRHWRHVMSRGGYAPGETLRSANTEREAVSVAGDGKR